MALVATPGAANANTYALVADVDAFILNKYVPTGVAAKWTALSTPQKEAALQRATQLLDRHVRWGGCVESDVQALSWPRAWALDRYGREIASTVIPAFLVEFQIETTLWLIDQAGVIPQIGNSEFDSIRVGSLEIDFHEEGGVRRSLLPEEVVAALRPMGSYVADTAGGMKMVELVRT
jgi:hypothetical protein